MKKMSHLFVIKIDTIFGIFFFVLLISFANLQSLYLKWFETYRSYGSMLLLTYII